ncbi:hypothetical protein HN014_12680 [Aquimarina sp. TRL1]|uniref:SMI1/KNR4 family protein n=1 Tax=Aquimarina sp. (strain TRL1) TaxID=2736252 RepID=UPI00158A5A2F|nr:SMI1/KNR4 family protein [Aquimarina sp. TRL1]QKX05728.1 hypothetical protein HN014_12680 [Aquimarina sp. TRL1]
MKKTLVLITLLFSCQMTDQFPHWKAYKQLIKERFPKLADQLHPGVSKQQLTDFEHKFDITLPPAFKKFYQLHNGEKEGTGYIRRLSLLSLEQIDKELSTTRKMWETNETFNLSWYDPIVPEGAIKKMYYNPKWIPFISDQTGNFIAIDLDPGPRGIIGQIINYGADEDYHYVLGNDINLFFKLVNKHMIDENVSPQNLRDLAHLTDYLKKMIDNK